jgi:hypothetical protein
VIAKHGHCEIEIELDERSIEMRSLEKAEGRSGIECLTRGQPAEIVRPEIGIKNRKIQEQRRRRNEQQRARRVTA